MLNHVPEGVRLGDFGRHPVRQTLQAAAAFQRKGLPSAAELDELKLSPTHRAQLRDACVRVADLMDAGQMADARELADEEAGRLIGALPAEQREPGYFAPASPEMAGLGPRELAALVPKRF